ncbi:MAG: HAMP domain-containing histidine kinase [Coriobacteriales bacterium]|jgi:signal transduction histidine kinase|nr:HAMP domain-containing histidine kinase [Coriobacteriales bacterium]
MKRLPRLLAAPWFVRVTGVLLVPFCLFSLYTSVPGFSDYRWVFRDLIPAGLTFGWRAWLPGILFVDVLTLALIALYAVSVCCASHRLKSLPLHKADYFYTALATIAFLVFVAEQWALYRNSVLAHSLLFACAFVLIGHLLTTTLVRLRARRMAATVYWVAVLRVIPLRTFTGAFVLVAVCVTTLVFLANCLGFLGEFVTEVYWLDVNPWGFAERYLLTIGAPALVLVMISVLCSSIIRLTAERERIAEEKLAAERFRTELITNVTHDIRTPLTSIINYIDLIDKKAGKDAQLQEYVSVLSRKSVRLKSLVNDLLDATKASAGNVDVTLELIDLAEIIGQVVGDFDDALHAASLSYVGPGVNHPVMIRADGRHLYRVLENLFANVVKYAMPGTRVYVSIADAEQTVALSIKNTSRDELNITPDELLQQFVRGDEARTAEGNGLGLFIAERLTHLMGARLILAINADLFEVNLKFAKPPAAAAENTKNSSALEG